jgi:spore maturation protein SpmB
LKGRRVLHSVKIIPYLVAMLVAIGVFRASGAMDFLLLGLGRFFALFGFDTEFVKALPVALMKPLSGGGARGLMVETMKTYGADSFPVFCRVFSRDRPKPLFM